MNELQAVELWIVQTLTGVDGLEAIEGRFFVGSVPQAKNETQTRYPAVVMSLRSAPETTGNGGARVMTRPLYLVKIVSEGKTFNDYARALSAIDAALTTSGPGQAVSYEDGPAFEIRGAIRENSVRYTENDSGRSYCHQGGLYRLFCYPAA